MTEIWAHRGARREAPENTAAGLRAGSWPRRGRDRARRAAERGRRRGGDARRDRRPHDGRHRPGGGPLARPAASTRRPPTAWPASPACRCPTLAEILELLAPTGLKLNIELKNSEEDYHGLEERVLAAVDAFGIADRVVLSTFNHYSLKKLQTLDTTVRARHALHRSALQPWRYAAKLGVGAIHPPARFVLGRVGCARTRRRPRGASVGRELRARALRAVRLGRGAVSSPTCPNSPCACGTPAADVALS